MIDEKDAVSSDEDETTEDTTETVEKTADDAAQTEAKADTAEQGDEPGDEADKPKEKVEAKDDEADKAEPVKKPNRKSAKERISDLTTIRRDQEREIVRLRAQLERTQKLERPDSSKYEDPDEYTSDLAVYKLRTSQTDDIEASVQGAEARANEALVQGYQEKVLDFAAETPDFHNVAANPALQITPEMATEIMDSDLGPQVQYYLGKNPREAARIASLPPNHQIRAIGQLEAKVSSPAPKRVTQAPAPIKPVAGTSKSRLSYSEDMSMADYAKMRAAGRNP